MRRAIPSVLLGCLLLFLLVIYYANPTNEVLALSVFLLGVGVYLAYGNQTHGLSILGGITGLLSFISLAFLGRQVGGPNGSTCFVGLWLIILLVGTVFLLRRAIVVERGQIMVINQLPENVVMVFNEGLHRPLLPFERRMATLPSYELIQETELTAINTKSLFNVDRILLLIRYQVESPRDVVFGLPNRERAKADLERERGAPVNGAEEVGFWSELIRRQMAHEVEEIVRAAVFGISSPTDVSNDRTDHAKRVKNRLQETVQRWGLRILELRFLEVEINPERIKAANRDKIVEREVQDAARIATMQADSVEKVGTAQARATARMVAEIVGALKEQGAELSADELEKIVITAMQRMTDTQQLSSFFRQISGPGGSSGSAPNTPNPPQGNR